MLLDSPLAVRATQHSWPQPESKIPNQIRRAEGAETRIAVHNLVLLGDGHAGIRAAEVVMSSGDRHGDAVKHLLSTGGRHMLSIVLSVTGVRPTWVMPADGRSAMVGLLLAARSITSRPFRLTADGS